MAKKTIKKSTVSAKSTTGKKKVTAKGKTASSKKATKPKSTASAKKVAVKKATTKTSKVRKSVVSKKDLRGAKKVNLKDLKKVQFEEQFHKCTPPPEVKEDLKIQSIKNPIDRSKIRKFLTKLPPIREKSQPRRGFVLKDALRAPQWNAVALFCNLHTSVPRPSDYSTATSQDVLNWMDEGVNPSNPNIKDFTYDYWNNLSHGNLRFSIEVVRDASKNPVVPTITPSKLDAHAYPEIAEAIIRNNPEGVWEAGGSIMMDGKRFIPCVFVVHKYYSGAWAWYSWGLEFTSGGHTYYVNDFTHIPFDLTQMSLPGGYNPRNWAHPLFHEFAHTFIEGPDLYGPGGCTGYWDILGDYLAPGLMAESCSLFKERLGWINFKEVISGPNLRPRTISLRPYTTTGDAFKVIPDPVNNPYEYFLLEYRKSTGSQPHIPDGGLVGEGLLIIHINERLGQRGKPWILREAPFFDPEYADFSDFGEAMWHGIAQQDQFKVLYPTPTNNSFTPSTQPNSHFYGNRPSGLQITNIRFTAAGTIAFELSINCVSNIGWTVDNKDRGVAGRFSGSSSAVGEEIFMRNDNSAALITQRGGQVFVKSRQNGWIDGWNLGSDNREIVGDFDGDGRDEIFVRSPEWAGIFKYHSNRFRAETVQHDWIDGWNLGPDNWELTADLDGDGKDEIYIRSPRWAGVLTYSRGRLRLKYIVQGRIDEWALGEDNKEYVGRFSQNGRDEILVKSPEWLGLIVWDSRNNRLDLKKIHHDWIDGWNLGPNDEIYIADLDGDGLDEIYIRSAKWAGVLKWQTNKFVVLWMVKDFIPDINDVEDKKLALTGDDKSYGGKFFETKDGIIHRVNGRLALLIWENNRMNVRFGLSDRYFGGWNLGPNDKFILGDFHKVGIEGHVFDGTQVLPQDHVTNNLTDVFVHNGWGTGMLCLNYVHTDFSHDNWKGAEWVLSWIQSEKLIKI